jgi:hypothetical protein
MSKFNKNSLLGGRNQAPLSLVDIRRATQTFIGLDQMVNVRYEEMVATAFHIAVDENGQEYGEIVFGPDLYSGSSVVDPNSALGLQAVAAHELTHYYRWKDKTQLIEPSVAFIDEALTSLQAIMRYDRQLSEPDVRQLVSDAIQRLQLYVQEQQALNAESGS